jgi:hypothetical protein
MKYSQELMDKIVDVVLAYKPKRKKKPKKKKAKRVKKILPIMLLAVLTPLFQMSKAGQPVPRQAAKITGQGNNTQTHQNTSEPANPNNNATMPYPATPKPSEQTASHDTPKCKWSAIVTADVRKIHKDMGDYLYIGATLLVALGTLTLARIAYIQAQAARLNAQAVINSERPWMVAYMEELPQVTDQSQANLTIRMACHVKNIGRTPAILFCKGDRREILEKEKRPTIPPVYENKVVWERGSMMPPKAEILIVSYLEPSEREEVYTGKRVLWFYGAIRYKDAFGKFHWTKYCFRYTPQLGGKDPVTAGFYPDGPPEYNEAT